MDTSETREKINALKIKIRAIEKTLNDRRINHGSRWEYFEKRKIERRRDKITSNIFDNTVKYHEKREFPTELTEKFIDGVRSGIYG